MLRFAPQISPTLRTKSQLGPLVAPGASTFAVRVVTSHTPPSDLAQKGQKCAKAPPQAPSPRTPHSAREVSQKRARGAGAVKLGTNQPRPSLSRLQPSHRTRTTSSIENQQAHHAAPAGAADFPCLRQLPPPPKRTPAQKGSDVEKNYKNKQKIKKTREKQKERENKTQRRSTAGNETKGSTADVAESMLSRSEDYVSPAREAETSARKPKNAHFPPY